MLWSPAVSLSGPRSSHTATLLSNGQVLVVGGQDRAFNSLASAERYDPVANRWVSVPPMAIQRSRHSATLLRDGRVLIIGGSAGANQTLSTAAIYDPDMNRWTVVASMSIARSGHTASLLHDGRVLVVGGGNNTQASAGGGLNTAEIYDPATNRWISTPPMSAHHNGHTDTVLPNNKVLIAGGFDLTCFCSHSVAELYDVAMNRWIPTPRMGSGRSNHTATLLPDNQVLVTGGSDRERRPSHTSAELYDPIANRWVSVLSMSRGRSSHTATLLPDGEVLVLQSHLYCQVAGLLCYGAESAVRGCGTAVVMARANVALRLVFRPLDNTSATVKLWPVW